VHGVFGSECPQCGADVIAPEWCEHVSAHCVRNVWSCEACDYQFEEKNMSICA
jgi:rubredoxin